MNSGRETGCVHIWDVLAKGSLGRLYIGAMAAAVGMAGRQRVADAAPEARDGPQGMAPRRRQARREEARREKTT